MIIKNFQIFQKVYTTEYFLINSPSEHQSFDTENESDEQRTFEEAEMFGKSGGDCDFKYGSKCLKSPLESVSHYIHSNNDV